MNNTVKNAIRLAGVVVGLGAAVWALRDRLLPSPEISDEPPPKFRVPSSDDAPGDDLTAIKGIGPVTAGRLRDAGIDSIAAITEMSPDALAEAAGASDTTAAKWIESAKSIS